MNVDTVVSFLQPGSFLADPLTDVLRSGARRFLAQAVEAEVEAHIAAHSDLTDGQGRRRIVRHGYLPEREIQTGIGAVRVQALREVYGEAPEQRCWVHKTINVLNQMPKSLQARAKGHLQDIWMAETKAEDSLN